jgi:uncharacterized protein YggE
MNVRLPQSRTPVCKMLVFAVAVVASPQLLNAQTQPRDTTIAINITRTGRAPADRASLYFGVEAIGETASAAIERLNGKLKAMQDSARRASPTSQADVPVILGVAPSAQTGYPPPQMPLNLARAALRITLSKLTDLAALQTAMSQAGATMSGGISYESSTVDAVWKAKSAEALQAVRATAEMAADTQGYKLGRLLNMNVGGGPQSNGFQQPQQLNFDARNSYVQMVAPEIVVNASVGATYLLVKK